MLRALTIAALCTACGGATLSPFRGHMEVGRDPYLLFVAEGPDGRPDIWAARPNGTDLVQVTFGAALEDQPAISPDGSVLAFLRRAPGDSSAPQVWLLNLLNGAEREIPLPKRGRPTVQHLGWSRDGRTLYLGTDRGVWRVAAPPAAPEPRPAPPAELPAADSALRVLVGEPPIARAERCADGRGVCVVTGSGATTVLAADGRDPVRWSGDSVGYFVGDVLLVRPLAAGRTRDVRFNPAPRRPRHAVLFPGTR